MITRRSNKIANDEPMMIALIGATAKIKAKLIVDGNATAASFTQLSIIPAAAATPPIIPNSNNITGLTPKRFTSILFQNAKFEFSVVVV